MDHAAHCSDEGSNDAFVHVCATGKAQGGVEVIPRSNLPLVGLPPDVIPMTVTAGSMWH